MFAFTDERNSGEEHHRQCQNNADQARDHEYRRAPFGIEVRPDFNVVPGYLAAWCRIEAHGHRAQLVGHTNNRRVDAIDQNVHRGPLRIECTPLEIRGNEHADGDFAAAQHCLQVGCSSKVVTQVHDLRLFQRELAEDASRRRIRSIAVATTAVAALLAVVLLLLLARARWSDAPPPAGSAELFDAGVDSEAFEIIESTPPPRTPEDTISP